MTCPGSVALCEGLEDKSSSYAAEGTAAHEMAETILRGDLSHAEAQGLIGQRADNGVAFTEAMLLNVLKYTDQMHQLVESSGGTLHVEQKLPIGQWTQETGAHGTSDVVIVAGDELIVADLKFGMGVEVSAVDNKQLMLYALAALDKFDAEAFV
jgi:hypothetical protein